MVILCRCYKRKAPRGELFLIYLQEKLLSFPGQRFFSKGNKRALHRSLLGSPWFRQCVGLRLVRAARVTQFAEEHQ